MEEGLRTRYFRNRDLTVLSRIVARKKRVVNLFGGECGEVSQPS